jgi:HPt (histidine-containing phosphotransfer) domain-containing protein
VLIPPLIDRERLDDVTGGDAAVREELTSLFALEAARYLASVELAADASDLVATKRALHGLWGSAATFGAARLAALCMETSRLVRSGVIPRDGIAEIRSVYEATCSALLRAHVSTPPRRPG